MAIIFNNRPRKSTLPRVAGKKTNLAPGRNDVPDEVWNTAKNHHDVQRALSRGELSEGSAIPFNKPRPRNMGSIDMRGDRNTTDDEMEAAALRGRSREAAAQAEGSNNPATAATRNPRAEAIKAGKEARRGGRRKADAQGITDEERAMLASTDDLQMLRGLLDDEENPEARKAIEDRISEVERGTRRGE